MPSAPVCLLCHLSFPPPLFVAVFVVCAWRWIYKLQLIKSWWVCVSEIKRGSSRPPPLQTPLISKWGNSSSWCWPEILWKMLLPLAAWGISSYFSFAQVIAELSPSLSLCGWCLSLWDASEGTWPGMRDTSAWRNSCAGNVASDSDKCDKVAL